MKKVKKALSFDEQIKSLSDKGLVFDDNERSDLKSFLSENNYYRLTGYSKLFEKKESDLYIDGFSYVKLKNIYNFDFELRNILFAFVSKIEISAKTQIAYYLSTKISPTAYLNKDIYESDESYNATMDEINKCIDAQKEQLMVRRYKDNNQNLPLWVLVEILPLGVVSRFFTNLKFGNQALVSSSEIYHFQSDYYSNYLHICVLVRNMCAHQSRFYGSNIPGAPRFSKKFKDKLTAKRLKISNTSKSTLFVCLIALIKLVSNFNERKIFFDQLKSLFAKYSCFIKIEDIGFPNDWYDILIDPIIYKDY